MAVKGVFTSVKTAQGESKNDFVGGILRTGIGGMAPLTALTSGMKKAACSDIIVGYFGQEWMDGRASITNNAGTGSTLVVNDASAIVPGQILMIENATAEQVLVTAVTGNTLTVQRGFNSTVTATNGSSTPVGLQRIGSVHEENSSKPVAVAYSTDPDFNYCQIFRNTWQVSGTIQAIEMHTEGKRASSISECSQFHAEDIERTLLFGRRGMGTINGNRYSTMAGIISTLSTNVKAAVGGELSYDDLDEYFESVFRYNVKGEPNERLNFCGDRVLTVLNKLARLNGQINIEVGQTVFGLKVTKWITPHGELTFVTHPLFSANPIWRKMFLTIHPGAIRMRTLRETIVDTYNRDAGVDGDYGVLTTEHTAEWRAEKCCGIFTGIDKAVADDVEVAETGSGG